MHVPQGTGQRAKENLITKLCILQLLSDFFLIFFTDILVKALKNQSAYFTPSKGHGKTEETE